MLRKLRQRMESEKGFTLIELLVVILIIGILAAIALPAFLGQRTKSQDSSAKSAARNAVSQVESCFTEGETYVGCTSNTADADGTGDVGVSGTSTTGFTVTATSKSGNTFSITKAGNATTRACTAGSDQGGCSATPSGTW